MRKFYAVFNGAAFKTPKWILGLFVVLLGMAPSVISAQTISVTNVTPNPVCAGSNVTIAFEVSNGDVGDHFTTGTNYQVYLSDASGSTFQSLGATFQVNSVIYNTTNGGTTTGLTGTATIPLGTATGAGYKIAIGSTSPTVTATAGAGASAAFTVNAQVTPTVSIAIDPPNTNTICAGSSVTFTAASTNEGTSPVYKWQVGGVNVGSNINTYTTSTLTDGKDVKVILTSNAACATGNPETSNIVVMKVNPIPTATATNSNQTICSGSAITTMAISGNVASATYNWTRDNTAGVTGIAGSGSGNISGTLTNTTNAPITVKFTITPTANGCPGTPIPATVLVNPTPTATATNSNQTICSGSVITTMAISGNVASATYNWTRDNTAGVTGIAGSGSGNISGTLTNTTNAPITVKFTITPTANGCPGTPIPATVLVNPTPTATATNSNQTICSGSVITTMAISGNVVSATYNWTRDNTAGVTGIAGSGSGNISGTLTNTTNAPITVKFTITPTANGCPGTPIPATVLVNPTPTATATNSNQTICSGSVITTMAISGNVASATYNWTRDNTAGVTGIAGSGSGNISGTLTNTTNAPITVKFTITPTANGCPGTPIPATVLVNPTPTATATNSNQTICSGSVITTMAISGNVASATYNWTRDNTVGVTGIAGSGSGNISGTLTNTTNAPITVKFTITPTANGCPGTPIPATVLVNPTPTATATNSNQTICSGSAITTMVISGNVTGATYNWTRDNTAGVTGIAGSGSGNISGTLTNTTNAPVTVKFTITPTANGCPGTPIPATVLVNPTPTATATNSNQAICSGSAITTMAISGNVASATYNWTRDNTAGVTGIAGSGSGNISGTLTNTTNAPITVKFTITPTANGCPGTPIPATVLVNPNASILLTSATSTTSQNICRLSAISNITYNVVGAATFNASGLPPGVTANLSGGVLTISGAPNNTISSTTNYNYTINTTGPCANTSTTGTIKVFVGGPSVGNGNGSQPTGSQSICPGPAATGYVYTAPSQSTNAQYYIWNLPPGFVITSGDSTSQITVSVPGPGAVFANKQPLTVTLVNPCGSVISGNIGNGNNAGVNVNKFNAVDAGSNFSMCSGTSQNLTNVISGAASKVYWSASSGTITGGPYPAQFVYTPSLTSGTATLTVVTDTASGSCNTSASFGIEQITVTINQPSAAPTSLSSPITICSGSSTTLTQTGGVLGTGAVWKWYTNSGYTTPAPGTVAADGSLTVSPTVTTTYYLRAETATSVPCAQYVAGGNITITVSQPSVAPTSLSNAITICSGSSTTLTQTGGVLGTGATWKWYTDAGYNNSAPGTVTATGSLSVSPITTTTYYLRAESTTGSPCAADVAATESVTVTVNQPSSVPTSLSSPVTICSGSSTTLTQTGGVLGTGAVWKWYTNSGYTTPAPGTVAADGSLTVSPTVTTTYYLRAETATSVPCAQYVAGGNVTITVSQPSVAPTSLSNAITICSGSSTTLTQTGGVLGTGATWKWYTDAGYNNSAPGTVTATGSLSVSPTTTTTYYLRAESTTGSPCAADVAATESLTVTVNQPSSAPTSLSSPVTICSGSSTTLTQTGGVLGTGAVWKWYTNSDYTTSAPGTVAADGSLTVSPTVTTTYYLRAETATSVPCAQYVAGGNVTITVSQPSVAPTSLSNAITICSGSSTTLTQTGGVLGTGATWKWYTDAGYNNSAPGTVAANGSLSVSPTTTTTYYLRAESTTGSPCAADVAATESLTVTVNQPSSAPTSLSSPVTICSGSSTTLTQTGGVLGTGAVWKWYTNSDYTTSAPGAVAADGSLTVSPTTTTTYYLRAESTTGAPCVANLNSGSIKITVNDPISITTQPNPSQIVCLSFPATFSVEASGTGLTYQWYLGTTPITGATSSTYNIAKTQQSDAGTYTVLVSGAGNICTPQTSEDAVLVVNQTITAIASSATQTECEGGTATFTVSTTGTATGYQWRKGGNSIFDGANISGTNTATLTITGLTSADAGNYDVVVSGPAGECSQVISNQVALTVNQKSANPTSANATTPTICVGGSTTLNLVGGGGGTGEVIHWYSDAAFTNSAGTGNALSVSPTVTTTYYGRYEDGGVCNYNSGSVSTIVTVNQKSANPTSANATTPTICVGGSTTLNLVGGGGGTGEVIHWYSDAAFTNSAGTGNALSVSPTVTTTYYGRYEDGGVCNYNSGSVSTIVTVNQKSANPTSANATTPTICVGGSTTLNLVGGGGGTGEVIHWYSDAAFTNSAGTGNALSVSPTVTTTYYGRYEDGGVCNYNSGSVSTIVTVNQKSANPTSANATTPTICVGGSTTLNLVGGGGGTGEVIHWYSDAAFTNSAGTGNALSVSPTVTTTYYGRYEDGGVCNYNSGSVSTIVTVNQKSANPTSANATTPTICVGGSTTLNLVGGGGGTGEVIHWYSDAAFTNSAGTGNALSVSPTVTTTYYGRYEDGGVCNYNSGSVSTIVTVNQKSANPTSANATTPTICVGGSTTLNLVGGGGGTGEVIHWYSDAAFTNSAGTGNALSVSPTVTTTYYGRYEDGGVCNYNSGSVSVIVTVSPLTVGGTASKNQIVCFGSTSTDGITLAGNTGSVVKWQKANDPNFTSPVDIVGSATLTTLPGATIGVINSSTFFRAVVQSSPCSVAYSSTVLIAIDSTISSPIIASPAATICLGEPLTLSTAGYQSRDSILGGDFNQANPTGWSGNNAGNNSGGPNNIWGETNAHTDTWGDSVYNNNTPSGNKFMITDGLQGSTSFLASPSFSTIGRTSLTLDWYQGYNFKGAASGQVQISINGSTWTTLATYDNSSPKVATNPFNSHQSIDLNAYLGQSNVMIRFYYTGTTGSAWALDDVNVLGPYMPLTYTWPSEFTVISPGNSATYTPPVAGTFTYDLITHGKCGDETSSITITVSAPAAITTAATSSSAQCVGGNANISAGVSGSPQWQISTNGGSSWSNLSNDATYSGVATTTLNISGTTPAMATYLYRIMATAAAPCSNSVSSDPVALKLKNVWTGTIDTDWNKGGNWSDGSVPGTSCPIVTIPVVITNNYPVLGADGIKATIVSLQIDAGASAKITGNTMQLAGSITNNGIFDVTDGTVEFNNTTTPQNIAGSNFHNGIVGKENTVKNLIVSNNVNVANTAGDTLNITGLLSFSIDNTTLTTGNNLTLKSTKENTASIGTLGVGNSVSGQVEVERYINIGTTSGTHPKSWQFLSTPTQGQSLVNSWMEGTAGVTNTNSTGYGAQFNGTTGTSGYDGAPSIAPSVKSWDEGTGAWKEFANTGDQLYNPRGYYAFVRGDRSVDGRTITTAKPTTLRSKGTIFIRNQSMDVPKQTADNVFFSIGNPYPSAVDMTKVQQTGTGIGEPQIPFFYVWSPVLNEGYGVGGWNTLVWNGAHYESVPGPIQNDMIQSGQAFLVQEDPSVDTKVTFTEDAKVSLSNNLAFREQTQPGKVVQLATNLFTIRADGNANLADGTLQMFDKSFSGRLDRYDARKIMNAANNLAIKTSGINLVVERREPLTEQDTIRYNMSSMARQNYRLEFKAQGLSSENVEGFVEDTYLDTRTPLNMEGTTNVDFAVTSDKGSYAANRFRIVFKTAVVLPVKFVSVTAVQKEENIQVDWKVENEKAVKQYDVEKSVDGVSYKKAYTVAADNDGAGSYQWLDEQATPGNNFYRIRMEDESGKISYSDVVKVAIPFGKPSIGIYPNPITDGIIHLQMVNQPKGRYGLRLLNPLGQTIIAKQVEHAGGNATENIKWDYNLAHGVYELQVLKPGGKIEVIKVMY